MSLKNKIATGARQVFAIDELRSKLDATKAAVCHIDDTITGTLVELSENIHARVRRADDEVRKLEEHVSRLHLVMQDLQGQLTKLALQGEATAQELTKLTRQQKADAQAPVSTLEQGMGRYCERLIVAEPWLPDESSARSEPEYYLAAFLYNFLPNRVAFDVGANQGDFMQVAADAGYEVFSFEPYSAVFQKLQARAAGRKNVKLFNFALGSSESIMPLHVASESGENQRGDASLYNTFRPHFVRENIQFDSKLDVPVRTISSLAQAGEVPADIDFLKVDTEGFDLEVIRGLGELRPRIVQAEFWGEDFVFVRNEVDPRLLVNSRELIHNMRARGYLWNLVIFRIEGTDFVRLATNLAEAPPRAWGNILFFREHAIYQEGFRWTQASLPRFQNPP